MSDYSSFFEQFRGGFSGVLRWEQLDKLWSTLRAAPGKHWYVYAVGEAPPDTTVDANELDVFLTEIDDLLRRDHDESYCGIVYTDSFEDPTLIKIFDPHNLGVSCGYSDNPPLPGWVLSLNTPVDLDTAMRPTASRRRWWGRIFGGASAA